MGDVILILLLVCVAIWAISKAISHIISHIKKTKSQKNLRNEIEPIIPSMNGILESLDRFFEPTKKVSMIDISNFLDENNDIIETVQRIGKSEHYFILNETGVNDFIDSISKESLFRRYKENNQVYDSIQDLNSLSDKAFIAYQAYTSDSRYFAYSEMEQFKDSFKELETLYNKVASKYRGYFGDGVENVLNLYKGVESERKLHNDDFIRKELTENKTYFDTVLGTYPLDTQQRDSIVKMEDNCLVIASAGSGKTSTILGKAKYLVEKRKIDPSKILLITYTKKAANELHERMQIEGMTCCTFHKLAKDIIANVTGRAPSFCDQDVQLNIFHKLIETNGNFLHAINNYIINQQSLMGLEHDYTDAFSYYEDRKKYGIQALFPDVDGKIIFTKSEEEKRLVSILTRLGVPFRYENTYQFNTTTTEKRQYRPDFTIYYQDVQGQWKWLYLEHFAVDSYGDVPQWFGDGERGGWQYANRRYKEGMMWKRLTHSQYGTILIETTSADFKDGTVESKLKEQLRRYGVPINERSDEELYGLLVKRSRRLEKSVFTLIQSFITLMKANEKTVDGLLNELETKRNGQTLSPIDERNKSVLINIIKPFFDEYQRTLSTRGEIDFTDAIIQASELCRKDLWRHYEYILVDEFQDISVDRYKFLQALRSEKPKTKLFCVGDDWQSIFRFAGSDMSLVYEFEKYFGYTEQCKIETTYRFHQPLIDKSSEFIMRNMEQKEKTIKTPSNDTYKTYLNFVKCDGDDKDGVLSKVREIVAKIPHNQSILLLGRYNYDASSVGFNGDIEKSDNRITVNIDGRELPFLSVHSAKGLEADHVILVNCNQGAFPSLIEDDPILDFVLSKGEAYPFAEERRLFYVAMTRARMCTNVLYDQKRPSPFISEFLIRIEIGSYLCPRCLVGKVMAFKDGVTANGEKFRIFSCSNHESNCNFFETKFGDLTPPGILITEEMTAQDVERLREERRKESKQYVRVTLPPIDTTPFPPPPPPREGSADDLPF